MRKLLGLVLVVITVSACKTAPPLSGEGTAIYAVGKPAEPRALVAFDLATCATRKDGIWCWGHLGMGLPEYSVPTRMAFDDVTSIALGGSHYCVLRKDRTIACAGRNLDGELGDGSFANRAELKTVPGMTNVVQLAAGTFKTCAIVEIATARHQVFCFGADEGRRGSNGLAGGVATPTRVGDIEDARELAVEWGLACVRRAEGSVWCWGSDTYGQLGRGSSRWAPRAKAVADPVRVLHVTDAVAIAPGGFSACVLTARGTIGCWGDGSYGGLGDGTKTTRSYPSDVTDLDDVAQVAGGSFGHGCARRRDGTVWRWGYRIGEEHRDDVNPARPARVASIDDAVAIAAGHTHECVLRKNGSIWCWGNNESGQLGDGKRIGTTTPHEIMAAEL